MTHEATARLDLPVIRSIEAFVQVAEQSGLPYDRTAGTLRLRARLGTIELEGAGEATALRVCTDTASKLQEMRDLLTTRIGASGRSLVWAETRPPGRPANLSLARLEALERISPSYMRGVIEGPDLARFARGGMHFRLLFGPEGAEWPTVGRDGLTSWPGGAAAWHRPVYTTREIELSGKAARITFDVFLHDGGRVTEWARRARPGEVIAITGPCGSAMPGAAGWLGLVADETAVPVAARILAALPADSRGAATLFVPRQEDIQDLAHPAGLRLRWALRGAPLLPVQAFDTLDIPVADRFLFFAAERTEAMAVRARLAAAGFARGEYHVASYWAASG